MNARQRNELVDGLLACQSISSRNIRDSVVEELRDDIKNNIQRSQTDRDDVASIVKTCLNYSNGLEELIAMVRAYESDSIPMQGLDRSLLYLFDFAIDEAEPLLQLLVVSSDIEISVNQLRDFYRALLPPGTPEQGEPLGLLAMLSHLWNLSRQPESQNRQRTYPILDFIEQLARHTGNRQGTSELRNWSNQIAPSLEAIQRRHANLAEAVPGENLPVPDYRRLTILASVLSYLYPSIEESGEVVAYARLNPVKISFRENPLNNWQDILAEANRRGQVRAIIEAALSNYPNNEWLLLAQREEELVASTPGDTAKIVSTRGVDEVPATAPPIPDQTLLRPISFFEEGILKARAVARVVLTDGGMATGFLTHDNLLITASFVLPTLAQTQQAVVQCNFQRTLDELYAQPEEFPLAPEEGFATSAEELWTAVRVRGNPNQKWGALQLTYAQPKINDRISIIQHPVGGPKQIALFDSIIRYVGDNRIQYSSSTSKGSSGAPVFDLDWGVIAIHHSGGLLLEPGSNHRVFRQEGTHINTVIDGLKAAGLYRD